MSLIKLFQARNISALGGFTFPSENTSALGGFTFPGREYSTSALGGFFQEQKNPVNPKIPEIHEIFPTRKSLISPGVLAGGQDHSLTFLTV
jgi:hypothetical protein